MGFSLGKGAVHRDLLAGFHHHGLADLQVLDRHLDDGSTPFHKRVVRPQGKQGLDGAVGALHGVALEDVGKAEQEQQQRPLERRAHDGGSESREHHEHIDIEDFLPE